MICPNKNCGKEIPEGAILCPFCGASVSPVPETDGPTLHNLKPHLKLAGKFRLVRRLGSGGMGDVWLAHDESLDEPVALKVLKPDLVGDKQAVADMKAEVKLTRRLTHPNIVRVHEFYEDLGISFISMEYVEGQSLADVRVEHGGRFSLKEVLPWLEQLAQAIDYAHGEKVLHRDIKPGNVLLSRSGRVKLADFGIARLAKDTHTRVTGEVSSGTLVYMSPEQLMGEKLDARADVYSLAASVYELLCGHPPFYTGSIPTQIQLKAPEPIEGISGAVNTVVLRGLAKKREDRQLTARQFYEELTATPLLTTAPVAVQPPRKEVREEPELPSRFGPPEHKTSSLGMWLGILVVILASVGVGFYIYQATLRSSPELAAENVSSSPPSPVATPVSAPAKPKIVEPAKTSAIEVPPPEPPKQEQPKPEPPNTERRPGETKTFDGFEMVWCPPGRFTMGSNNGSSDEKPPHEVTLTKGFWLGKYEVTQSQWEGVMGNNPSNFKGSKLPVEEVSWDDIQGFLQKLNAKGQGGLDHQSLGDGGFRLPTEAEWEYACRAGSTSAYSFGNDVSDLGRYAWYDGNSGNTTHEVGTKQANDWNLNDMHGNVWEWCQDWYGDYPSGSVTDPSGPSSGKFRVLRGGSWYYCDLDCRSASRSGSSPAGRNDLNGFRLARTP